MFLKSIRFKITVWYMLILGATLCLFSILVYGIFSNNAYESMDDLLESKASGIATSIDTYLEMGRLDTIKEEAGKGAFSKIDGLDFKKIAQHWLEDKSDEPKLMNIVVHIYDAKGKLIASSKNAPDMRALMKEILDYVLEDEDSFDNFNIKSSAGKISSFRVFTLPGVENGKVAYIVQVASPATQIYAALKNLKITLFIFLPLTVAITGIAGAFLAKLALRPVNSMIKTIRQITAENLKLRVSIPDTKDEIKKLADTFNDMLVKLEEAFSSERKFIQDVSHELRTPLTILRGELEVALKKLRSPEEYESVLQSSLEEIDRISKIVDNLLILARFETKEVPLEMRPVDLNSLVQDIANDIDILAQEKNIKINFKAKERIILAADASYLKRLFLNLLDNAVKYTQDSGNISLDLSSAKDFAKIKISDTGIGIASDKLPFIFNRFYRAGQGHYNVGFGLGLAIAKSIVEIHKGRIEVESRPGQGSAFTVYLPTKLP